MKGLRAFFVNACEERATDMMSADWILGHIYNPGKDIRHGCKTEEGHHVIVNMGLSKQAVRNEFFHVDEFVGAKLIMSLNTYMKKRKATYLNITTDFELTAITDPQHPSAIAICCDFYVERDGIKVKK
jgi:hypothetical protein